MSKRRTYFSIVTLNTLNMSVLKSYISISFLIIFSYSVNAQVTIGSKIGPSADVMLNSQEGEPNQQNTTTNQGVFLPRVELTSSNSLVDIVGDNLVDPHEYAGLTVFHVSSENIECQLIPSGIYVWDGTLWSDVNEGGTKAMERLGSAREDHAALAKILKSNPNSTLDWVVSTDTDGNLVVSGSELKFEEICGEQRLVELVAVSSNISWLNVTDLTQLTKLIVSDNKLTELDLSANKNLTFLDCSMNKLGYKSVKIKSMLKNIKLNPDKTNTIYNWIN